MPKKFSKKYRKHVSERSPLWRAIGFITRFWTGERCVLFPWLKATQVHHLGYQRLGREIPLLDVVPLSAIAHHIVGFPLLRIFPFRFIVNNLLRLSMLGWTGCGLGWVVLWGVGSSFAK